MHTAVIFKGYAYISLQIIMYDKIPLKSILMFT